MNWETVWSVPVEWAIPAVVIVIGLIVPATLARWKTDA